MNLGNFVFDQLYGSYHTYMPYIGLAFIVGILYIKLKDGQNRKSRKYLSYFTAILLIYLGFFIIKSMTRNKDWENTEILLTQVIENGRSGYDRASGYFYRGNLYDTI